VKRLFAIMGSRWDLLDENRPFLGNEPMPPGHDLFPHDLTAQRIDQYVKQHPEDKAGIYDPVHGGEMEGRSPGRDSLS
jgi:hypothetical protein